MSPEEKLRELNDHQVVVLFQRFCNVEDDPSCRMIVPGFSGISEGDLAELVEREFNRRNLHV